MSGNPNESEIAATVFFTGIDGLSTAGTRITVATASPTPVNPSVEPGAAPIASSDDRTNPTPQTATIDAAPLASQRARVPDTKTILRIPDTLEVLTSKSNFWSNALSIENDRLLTWQRRMGYPVVVISAFTGLGAYSQLESNPAWWATLVVATGAIIAAALAAIQTQGNFAARAATAAQSSAKFGTLFRMMLEAGDQLHEAGRRDDEELHKLYRQYEELKSARPHVPQRVRAQAHRTVTQEAASIRAQAAVRAS
jgi:hypothetical protein